MTHRTSTCVIAVVAVLLAGCGGGGGDRSTEDSGPRVDTAAFGKRIQRELGRITGTVVDNVACPSNLRATAGRTFICGASFNGEADNVVVTIGNGSDARDDIQLRLQNLLLGKLEADIRASFVKQKVRLLSLDCAGPQAQRQGGTFRCRAEDSKLRKFDVEVKQTDDAGTVSFRVVR